MSVSLEQIFKSPGSEVFKILGITELSYNEVSTILENLKNNPNIHISLSYVDEIDLNNFFRRYPNDQNKRAVELYVNSYIELTEKFTASGQLIEADMYYMRDYHDLFVKNLHYISINNPFNMFENLEIARKEIKVHNSKIIIEAINELLFNGKVNDARKIRKSYNVTDTELFDGVSGQLYPFDISRTAGHPSWFIKLAEVYNLNEPKLTFAYRWTDYDVLAYFNLFFKNIESHAFSLVDRYFELYNIPNNRYWYVVSLIILYSIEYGYSDKDIHEYIDKHKLKMEEAEKGDLVMVIFMTVMFNIENGEMLKSLINGYNRKYPNQTDELNSALNYCIRESIRFIRLDNWDNINITYPREDEPEYLDYGIYSTVLDSAREYFRYRINSPVIQRLIQNNDYIDQVRMMIYTSGAGNAKRI